MQTGGRMGEETRRN